MAAGVLIGAAFANDAVGVTGTISANSITGLTWFVIGGRGASRADKAGAWVVTILATGYLVVLMFS